ncbi:dUTP diphosphatase [Clostridium akagii]|uniref:dUTP diphosphatase n=1 Tax=Clostridium akagii TaxID=91623 RepID=UPI00068E28D5|nr:dUTP diphosphatase [Clostridium akagii]
MDLNNLLKKQHQLDTIIFASSGENGYPLEKNKIALLVELGELAKEWKGFKYWSKNKVEDRVKLVDEFVDCLYFALSLENYLQQVKPPIVGHINKFMKEIDDDECHKNVLKCFKNAFESALNRFSHTVILISIIDLGRCLDITLDEMEQAYLAKYLGNKKNIKNEGLE